MYVYIVVHTSCYVFFSFSCSSLLVLSLHSSLSSVTNKGTHRDIYTTEGDWRIRITIDADIPPPSSTQGKHIGFGVDFKGTPKVTGHIWCDAVPRGRPGTGVSMRENTITDRETTVLPNGDQVIFSLKTYSI